MGCVMVSPAPVLTAGERRQLRRQRLAGVLAVAPELRMWRAKRGWGATVSTATTAQAQYVEVERHGGGGTRPSTSLCNGQSMVLQMCALRPVAELPAHLVLKLHLAEEAAEEEEHAIECLRAHLEDTGEGWPEEVVPAALCRARRGDRADAPEVRVAHGGVDLPVHSVTVMPQLFVTLMEPHRRQAASTFRQVLRALDGVCPTLVFDLKPANLMLRDCDLFFIDLAGVYSPARVREMARHAATCQAEAELRRRSVVSTFWPPGVPALVARLGLGCADPFDGGVWLLHDPDEARSVGRLHRLAYGVTVWCLLVVAVVLCSPSLHRQCMRHMAWNQGGREPLNAEGVRGLVEQAGALAGDAVMAGYARRCLLLAMDVYAAAAEEGQPALVLQAGIWSELFDDVTG